MPVKFDGLLRSAGAITGVHRNAGIPSRISFRSHRLSPVWGWKHTLADFGAPMIDYHTQLEKLRRDAAECTLIADLATSPQKRELFAKVRRAFWVH